MFFAHLRWHLYLHLLNTLSPLFIIGCKPLEVLYQILNVEVGAVVTDELFENLLVFVVFEASLVSNDIVFLIAEILLQQRLVGLLSLGS